MPSCIQSNLLQPTTSPLVIAATIPGNSFPVIEGIYKTDSEGKLMVQRDASGNVLYNKDKEGKDNLKSLKYERNPASLYGTACRPGYQSHSVMGAFILFSSFFCSFSKLNLSPILFFFSLLQWTSKFPQGLLFFPWGTFSVPVCLFSGKEVKRG